MVFFQNFDLPNTHTWHPSVRDQSSAFGSFDFQEAAVGELVQPVAERLFGANSSTHLLSYYSDSVCSALLTYVSQLETVLF